MAKWGSEEDVPAILEGLRRHPPSETGVIGDGTYACFLALNRIAGRDLPMSVPAWQEWWKERSKKR